MALRTLRQLPKPVGETAGGEPVYEVRSVRLLLDATTAHFVRMAECSRCGRDMAGAPVLTPADLDRPLRPMICTDCIRRAGVSTVWESENGEPAEERPAPAALAPSPPEPAPAPPAEPAEGKRPERLDAMEHHLRAVTDRVNELGRVARAHQAELKERSQREEATAAALREELAALRASTDDTRTELQGLAGARAELRGLAGAQAELRDLAGVQAELQRLAAAQAELERRLAERPPAGEAGAGARLHEEVAQLARLVEAQREEVVGFVAAVGENQVMTGTLAEAQEALAQTLAGIDLSKIDELIATRVAEAEARLAEAASPAPAEVDLTKVEELIATRLAEAEGRLAQRLARQWRDLETAIESVVDASMAGVVRANEALTGGQAGLEEQINALTGQVREASARMETVLGRLDALEAAYLPTPAPLAAATTDPSASDAPPRGFLDSLDRQLEAAARRLAARSQTAAGRGES